MRKDGSYSRAEEIAHFFTAAFGVVAMFVAYLGWCSKPTSAEVHVKC
jgi:hypothetical protein